MATQHRSPYPHTLGPQPRPRGPPWREGRAESQGLAAADSVCSQEERGRRDRPAEARGSRARGGERPAALPGRVGKGRPGSGTSGYLTSDGESRSRRNTKKPGRSLAATRSLCPAPSAIGRAGSRRSALHITKTQLAQSESSRPRPLAHPASLPPYQRSFKSERKKKTGIFFLTEC